MFLLGLRLASAWYATSSDTRATARWIAPHLGHGRVEVVVLDDRVYGLSFYLGVPVEIITNRQRGGPQYWPPESWATELAELATTPRHHLFLVHRRLRNVLTQALASTPARCREVDARGRRHLIACDPGSDPPPPRLALWLETPATAGERFQAIDELRELDEWHGLDRVVVLRHPSPALSVRRFLDSYQTWPLEARGVPIDIVEPRLGVIRREGATSGTARIIATRGPALGEVVYGVSGRSDGNAPMAPWRIRLLMRCGQPQGSLGLSGEAASVSAELREAVAAVFVLCPDDSGTGGRARSPRLAIRGPTWPHDATDTIDISVDQLRGHVLLFEFRPATLDVVLTTAGYRDPLRLRQIRYWP